MAHSITAKNRISQNAKSLLRDGMVTLLLIIFSDYSDAWLVLSCFAYTRESSIERQKVECNSH